MKLFRASPVGDDFSYIRSNKRVCSVSCRSSNPPFMFPLRVASEAGFCLSLARLEVFRQLTLEDRGETAAASGARGASHQTPLRPSQVISFRL